MHQRGHCFFFFSIKKDERLFRDFITIETKIILSIPEAFDVLVIGILNDLTITTKLFTHTEYTSFKTSSTLKARNYHATRTPASSYNSSITTADQS